MFFIWLSEQKSIISIKGINRIMFVEEIQCVFCEKGREFSNEHYYLDQHYTLKY